MKQTCASRERTCLKIKKWIEDETDMAIGDRLDYENRRLAWDGEKITYVPTGESIEIGWQISADMEYYMSEELGISEKEVERQLATGKFDKLIERLEHELTNEFAYEVGYKNWIDTEAD